MARISNESDKVGQKRRFFSRTLGPEVTGMCCVGFQNTSWLFLTWLSGAEGGRVLPFSPPYLGVSETELLSSR